MTGTGYAIAAGAGLLIVAGGAWATSRPQQKAGQGAPVATDQPTILEVMGMENITEVFEPSAQSDKRGIRNNNPLNIEHGDNWQGMAAEQPDPRFVRFIDARYGYRAAAKIITGAYASRGVTTLAGILGTWAPKGENDLQAYIAHVSSRAGIAPMQNVTRDMLPRLFEAMTLHENGEQPYTLDFIREGVAWA